MAAVYNSPEFVTEMRFWHWLRMNLQPYLMATAFRCAAEKVPMMRPLVYEWPQDKAARQVEDEFLLGERMLSLLHRCWKKTKLQEKSICRRANGTPFLRENAIMAARQFLRRQI